MGARRSIGLVAFGCLALVACMDVHDRSLSQQTARPIYDVTVDCDDAQNDVAAVQAAVDESIGQPGWSVKVVGTCDFAGDGGGLFPEPISCNVAEDCPLSFGGEPRVCEPRASAPVGYTGFCFVHRPNPDGLILENADPFARATNTVFVTSSVIIDGHGATIINGGFHVGWDGYVVFGGAALTPPDLVTGIPSAPVHPARSAPAHWDGISYGVDYSFRYGGRWARAYPDVDVTIRGFHVERGFMAVGAARNVVVEDNVTRDASSYFYDAWYKPGPVLRSSGITIGGFLVAPWTNVQRFHLDGDIVSALQPTGAVVVRRNVVNGVGETPIDVSLAYAGEIEPLGIVAVFNNAALEIANNTVENVAVLSDYELSKGIAVLDNFGTTLIHDNLLRQIARRGIVDWSLFLPSNHAVIEHNRTANCSQAGIASLAGSQGEYRHNRIDVAHASASCIELTGSNGTLVGGNICSGTGDFGLLLVESNHNTFRGNNLASFDPSIAHVRLERSSYNVFIGYTGTVSSTDSVDNAFTAPK